MFFRNNSVSPINQLLCCLRFFASSGHLSSVADFMHMDTGTASRIVAKVSRELSILYPQFIKMPSPREIIQEQEKFNNMFQFPRIIGVVDGTHIKISSPGGDDAEVFRNRKTYFSLNVQVTGNADMKFIDVVARWPGSAHDATIFANSRLRARFEAREFPNSLLIGDSGYGLKEYFMTPLENPLTRGEQRYNESLIRTRNIIERIIGIWKRRFPVIAYGIRLKLETVMAVIVATAVLHNIARDMNEPDPPIPDELNLNQLNYLINAGNINVYQHLDNEVNLTQNGLIQYFNE